MSNPLITLKDVTKIYDNEVVALSKVNMDIYEGITGFIGPNGAGKTTVLNLLIGQLKPDIGTVRILGHDPFYDYELHKDVVMINELMNLKSLNFMKVETFLHKFGAISLSKQQARENTRRALDIVNLSDAKHKNIQSLSKGMRQRLKIAYALTINPYPKIILADEPLSGLDPLGRQKIFDLFRNLYKEYGTSTLISSHLLFEVDQITNSGLVLIYNGKIVATGKTHQIRKLLNEFPYKFQITCAENMGKDLAKHLLKSDIISISVNSQSQLQEDTVTVSTTNPNQLYQLMPRLFLKDNLGIKDFVNLEENMATESIFKMIVKQ